MRIRRILVAFGAALALFCVAPGAAPPATATDGTAAIKGQVLSWMDPIGDARVTVFNADTGAVVASVQTDGEGYYLVSGLRARHVKVRATKAGYLAAWASGVGTRAAATIYTLVPGQTLEQTWDEQRVLYLDLTPEGVVTGTVVGVNENPAAGPDGGPLAGARVTVVDQRTGGRIGSAVTDADGRFRIGMLAAGSVRVKAAKAGWLTAWAPNHPMGEVVDFPVLAGQVTDIGMFRLYAPATVFGEVVSNHHRIRGTARLTVFNADTGKAIRSLTVGSRFRITGLAPGTIQVRVTKHGYVDGWSSLLTLKAGQVLGPHVEQGALRIELTRGAVVTGEVMGFSQSPTAGWDDPLPGVKVTAVNARTGRKVAAGLTDESGRFRIGVVGVRTVKVKAAKTGWLTSWAPGERTRAEGDRITLRLGEVTDIGTVA
ncbi:MAG: carboxypeptidase regulatory-like domain-containing protein, partial [Propionibacteriaceae bacterium]|nr:carboxypeptidase regulatory-like domain-containing protein [Propionibacteriaceae bacterium]